MAGDLIPPPSPAGRPLPDPEPHADPVADATRATEPQVAPESSGPSPFRTRFGFMIGMLLGCAIAAGLGTAALLTTGKGPEEGLAKNWSSWHPANHDPLLGADEIARHIQSRYKGKDGRGSLVSVSGGTISLEGTQLAVAIQSHGGDPEFIDGNGVQYALNGLGVAGMLSDHRPDKARDRMLRREALELALYSFRYLPDVTMVVALLPREPKTKAAKKAKLNSDMSNLSAKDFVQRAIFYRPGDLRPQLEVPLVKTLALKAPAMRRLNGHGEEAQRIDSLTNSNLFKVSYAAPPGGQPYLVLNRP
jgi:hypothetical protein